MTRRVTTPTGRSLDCLNLGEARATVAEVYEDECYGSARELAGATVVVDVGANIGVFSVFCLDAAPAATVVCLEPIPAVHRVLVSNLTPFGDRARPLRLGAGRPTAAAPFVYYPNQTIMSGRHADEGADRDLVRRHITASAETMSERRRAAVLGDVDALVDRALVAETVECPVMSVSQLMAEHGLGHVDLLKVDAERSELEILESVADEDWPRIGAVAVEVEDTPRGRQCERAVAHLEARGFAVSVRRWLETADRSLNLVRAGR